MAWWSAVIPVCNPEQEELLGCHMAGNVMRFLSEEEDRKIPGFVADLVGCHGAVAGETFFYLFLSILAY